jgi:hypothetical protein
MTIWGVDTVIPEAAWRQGRTDRARQVREALNCCDARLRKDKEFVNEDGLFADIDAAITALKRSIMMEPDSHKSPDCNVQRG